MFLASSSSTAGKNTDTKQITEEMKMSTWHFLIIPALKAI
jgi:hypothetical protein